jgi:hypothetical protein
VARAALAGPELVLGWASLWKFCEVKCKSALPNPRQRVYHKAIAAYDLKERTKKHKLRSQYSSNYIVLANKKRKCEKGKARSARFEATNENRRTYANEPPPFSLLLTLFNLLGRFSIHPCVKKQEH